MKILATLLLFLSLSAHALPSFHQVKQTYQPSDTVFLDRHGVEIQRIRVDKKTWRGDWTALEDISPALRMALLVSEDKRFYQHSGVDWRAVGAAAWGNLWHSKTRGASTITMQLAGLLDDDIAIKNGRRSSRQKITQAIAATRLEHSWRKNEILEAYLNLAPFRGELVGVAALSQRLYNKHPSGLNEEEAAIAAALLRSPNDALNLIAQRACTILRDMQPAKAAAADCQRLPDIVRLLLGVPGNRMVNTGIAPHFARKVLGNAQTPSRIRTTLDARLQNFAQATLNRHLRELIKRNVEDGALIVIDRQSGDVLAWVGSGGPLSDAIEVDNVSALRQAGSTLKPFLYTQAIAEKRLTAASLLDDTPVNLSTGGGGLYIPQNYDKHFKGWVSLRTALASSLNIPAVRTLVMVSPDRFGRTLADLGLPLDHDGDFYGYSLALGSADVSLVSLANAYRTLANGGRASDLRLRSDAARPKSRAILNPQAAFIVGDILADRNARALTFGLDSPLATRYWSAVKTGTSKDMRDNWCMGFSERYVVGVWVGNASGEPMWDVSGISGAAPVWHAVMNYLHQTTPSNAPVTPKGIIKNQIRFTPNLEASRSEYFLPGTVQHHITLAQSGQIEQSAPRISQPINGARYAIDPDIPPANQHVVLSSDYPQARWRADGKYIGRGQELKWPIWPGWHTFELIDRNGKVADSVKIEVRGAGLVIKTPKPKK